MKKPVKLAGTALQEVIDKRKNRTVTVRKSIPAGTLSDVTEALTNFAIKEGVPTTEVRFVTGYYACMQIRRTETDAEKARRVRADEEGKYRQKKYDYERWVAEQQRAKAVLNTNSKTCCCKCRCC